MYVIMGNDEEKAKRAFIKFALFAVDSERGYYKTLFVGDRTVIYSVKNDAGKEQWVF